MVIIHDGYQMSNDASWLTVNPVHPDHKCGGSSLGRNSCVVVGFCRSLFVVIHHSQLACDSSRSNSKKVCPEFQLIISVSLVWLTQHKI